MYNSFARGKRGACRKGLQVNFMPTIHRRDSNAKLIELGLRTVAGVGSTGGADYAKTRRKRMLQSSSHGL